jgi:hypothetical protein
MSDQCLRYPPKADVNRDNGNVRFVPKATCSILASLAAINTKRGALKYAKHYSSNTRKRSPILRVILIRRQCQNPK